MIQPQSFLYREDGPVAEIRLDRPDVMNALTFQVYRELTDTFVALAARRACARSSSPRAGAPSAPAATCARSSAPSCATTARSSSSSPGSPAT